MPETPVPGAAMQAAFAARGYDMTIDEAREFVETMIDLISRGLIGPVDEEGDSRSMTADCLIPLAQIR